jgi:F-type H+-transporting ATPase subunit a
VAKLILGIALVMVLAGLCLGAIGAAVLGNEPYVKLPAVHIAPQAVVEFGDRSDVWDFGQLFSGFTITNTLISAWLTTGLVVLLFGLGTRSMKLVPGRLQGLLEMLIEALYNFVKGVSGERYARSFFPILATMFIFVAFNAWMALLPFYPTVGFKEGGTFFQGPVTTHLLRSAATDINLPIALAIIAFMFAEVWGFKVHKVSYLKEFFRGPNPIQTFVGVLELVSHFIRLISFTFRLFGNMVAGEIVLGLMTFLLVFLVPIAFYGLEILVGGVQGLIFMGLTLVFTVMAVAPHEGHEEEHSAAA